LPFLHHEEKQAYYAHDYEVKGNQVVENPWEYENQNAKYDRHDRGYHPCSLDMPHGLFLLSVGSPPPRSHSFDAVETAINAITFLIEGF
jgi:hypothetical protein